MSTKELKMKRHESLSLKLVNGPSMLLKVWTFKVTKTRYMKNQYYNFKGGQQLQCCL